MRGLAAAVAAEVAAAVADASVLALSADTPGA